jgi:hypothetical protein
MSEDGDTFVIQPGPEFKVVGKNSHQEGSASIGVALAMMPERSTPRWIGTLPGRAFLSFLMRRLPCWPIVPLRIP